MSLWNRVSFRPGKTANYDALKDSEPAAEQEIEEGQQEEGRGDAVADLAPKPQPGDELYDAIHGERAESQEQAKAHHQPRSADYDTAAAMVLYSEAQQQASPGQEQPVEQSQPTLEPAQQRENYDTFQAMRAQQAASVEAPQPTMEARDQDQAYDTARDFVTADTKQQIETERDQMQQQRSRSMGLTL